MFSSVIALLATLTVMVSSVFLDQSRSNYQWGTLFQEQRTDQPQDDGSGTRPVRPMR
jgi:hypothetical protein